MDILGRLVFSRDNANSIGGSTISNLASRFDRMAINESIGSSIDEGLV